MPCILQAHASRVKFDSASLTNANMRDTNPSLNVIQPKDGSSKRPREELTSEQKRFDKNVALNQAYQDHKSLNKIKNKDLSAKDFFNKSKVKRATSAHGPVRVGTDCSGMSIFLVVIPTQTPKQSLKQTFQVKFFTRISQPVIIRVQPT